MNTVGQYARVATSLSTIASILTELGTTFADVQQRTSVDDAMIDALVAAANGLASSATDLKAINYTPPA